MGEGTELPGFETGILFVHGIGQQRPGDTLIGAGRPFLEWLRAQTSCTEIRVTRARQKATDSPAYAVLEGKIAGKPIRWLLAESCWADEFYVPESGEFAAWLLGDGSWITLQHITEVIVGPLRRIAERFGNDPDMAALVTAILLGAPIFLFVLLPFQIAVVLPYLLSVLPIPKVGELAKAGFRSLAEILGDSFVYAGNEVSRVSVETKVRGDLAWLAGQCGNVAMVAHSQGAAVALAALGQEPTPCSLITYGAGIRKLIGLEEREPSIVTRLIPWIWLYAAGLPWAVGTATRNVSDAVAGSQASWPEAGMAWVYLLGGVYLFGFLFVNLAMEGDAVAPKIERRYQAIAEKVSWTDLVATADPVPGGLLLRDQSPEVSQQWLRWESMPKLRCAYVCNEANLLQDHTSYWESVDDFLPRLYETLHDDLGAPDLGLQLSNPRHGNLWRRSRCWVHVVLSLSILVLVGVLYVAAGAQSRQWVASLAGHWLEEWTKSVRPFVPGLANIAVWGVSLALHICGFALCMRYLSGPAWKACDRAWAMNRWLSASVYSVIFLALWFVMAHLIWAGIEAASYTAIVNDAWRFLYWLHGVVFRGSTA